ncbi:hypothetical protein I41_00490 [Lacipirellula limnantheis]|uniref:Uncharacterized protein n=1 Tax=Lacipirellula limnantheis TaxID=2528024 RepID=A0A517TR92_9BACT|nr:hypothetical protein I41_00490 [Lacipirellula limnantheis]
MAEIRCNEYLSYYKIAVCFLLRLLFAYRRVSLLELCQDLANAQACPTPLVTPIAVRGSPESNRLNLVTS